MSFWGSVVDVLLVAGVLNLGLAFFNLLPVPPLDGFMALSGFLPRSFEIFCRRYQIVFFIGLLIALRSGVFGKAINFLIENVFYPLIV
jgi:Zn-dependent protease